MRISDWSSDVCSSDLVTPLRVDAFAISATIATAMVMADCLSSPSSARPMSKVFRTRCSSPISIYRPEHSVQSLRRSEEHTSELQSLMRISYAVFCLKKKTQQHYMSHTVKTTAI